MNKYNLVTEKVFRVT